MIGILKPAGTVFPKLHKLTTVLTSLVSENQSSTEQLTVSHRERIIGGTFPKEIVTCKLGNEKEIRLFCKYAAKLNHHCYGHRGGILHEIAVYSKLLQSMPFTTLPLRGVYIDEAGGEVWLVLEYLDGGVRVTRSEDQDAMILAASWIGQFHAAITVDSESGETTFLKAYDKEYYHGWVQRTMKYAGHRIQHYQWLESLFEQFDKVVIILLSAPLVVIHGEYYPENILIRDGKIFPVDWESAAIAAGEIDLASLTERWPEEIARRYESEYLRKRWPDGPSHDFKRTLCAARIYLHLRWLGERPERTSAETWRFEWLYSACKQLDLI